MGTSGKIIMPQSLPIHFYSENGYRNSSSIYKVKESVKFCFNLLVSKICLFYYLSLSPSLNHRDFPLLLASYVKITAKPVYFVTKHSSLNRSTNL